jgi:hypothetical protein
MKILLSRVTWGVLLILGGLPLTEPGPSHGVIYFGQSS